MSNTRDTQAVLANLADRIHDALKGFMDSDYYLVDAPYIRNVGDHLIFAGEMEFFSRFPNCHCRGIHSLETFAFPEIRESDTVFIHGGGNLGDVWSSHLDFQERVVATYPRNRIVVFPQSAHFQSSDRLERTKSIFCAHEHLTICARDEASYQFLLRHFPANEVRLVPDMAFFVRQLPQGRSQVSPKAPTLLFARFDAERQEADLLVRYRQHVPCEVRDWPTIEQSCDGYRHLRKLIAEKHYQEADCYFKEEFHPQVIQQGVDFISAYARIVSMRLHGLILALLLGKTDVRYVDNSYGKIGSLCRSWLDGIAAVKELSAEDLPAKDDIPELTVVVAAHKRPETIRETLESVFRQRGVSFEVLVFNGVVGPDPVDDVVREFPEAIYVKDAKCLTLSAKHRRGIELARTPFMYMIDDDDCLTDRDFFSKAVVRLRMDSSLAFVSGGVTFQIYEEGCATPVSKVVPLANEGRLAGVDFFRGCQVLFPKPQSTCTTVFRVSSVVAGEALFECSDSSIFLKASLNGDVWFMPDIVADYRVWKASMTHGRGSDMAFKLNVLEQKLALYRQAKGIVADALGWWAETFKMNFRYFERSIGSAENREKLIQWGLAHSEGSVVIESFCLNCRAVQAGKPKRNADDVRKIAELERRVRELQEKSEKLRKTKVELWAQKQEAEKGRADLWARLQSAEKSRGELWTQTQELRKRLGALWSQKQASEKAKSDLYGQLLAKEAQRRQLEKVLERLSKIVKEGESE